MTLHAALTPIEDCTRPFRAGAELEVSLWFNAVHFYDPRNRIFDVGDFAGADLPPVLYQAVANAARPDLTFLRSVATVVDLSYKTGKYGETIYYGASRAWATEPLPLGLGLRRLQQGRWSIPKEGEPFAALGFLGASANPGDRPVRVRVDAVLALDFEPLSQTFGTWRHDEQWFEGAVDVSNLGETVVIARLLL